MNLLVMTSAEIDQSQTGNLSQSWTQEALNMAVSCLELLRGWYVSGLKLMEDQE